MSPDSPLDPREIQHATGKGVRILVLDSGIETTHPAFANGPPIRSFRVEVDPDSEPGPADPPPPPPPQPPPPPPPPPPHPPPPRIAEAPRPDDVFGHGTAVASIIRKYAPDAQIDSVKVIGRPLGWSHFILAAIHFGIDH